MPAAVATLFALAACSSSPASSPDAGAPTSDAGADGASSAQPGMICLMTDVKGDFDDRSYISTAFRGIEVVKEQYKWKAVTAEPETNTKEAFAARLTALVGQKCDLIVAVSPLFGDATVEFAKANPSQKIQALDLAPDPPLGNVWGQTYAVSEATFLAGYVAAAATKTGKVATFGGLNIPPIQEFMDGFALGVKHYNATHAADVEVLGWDMAGRVGSFIDTFTDTAKAQSEATALLDRGADIVFPVAGGAGYGAADAVLVRGSAYVIGVDSDWAEHAAYKGIVLTSVLKRLDKSVASAVDAVIKGTFSGGTRTGTLANTEVDIAPFHEVDAIVPPAVKAELPALRAKIVDGSLKTKP